MCESHSAILVARPISPNQHTIVVLLSHYTLHHTNTNGVPIGACLYHKASASPLRDTRVWTATAHNVVRRTMPTVARSRKTCID